MTRTSLHPTQSHERIMMLDTLRGFALFGILMVNMQIFYQPVSAMLLGYQDTGDALKSFSEGFIKFFFEGKFYVLFSLLFGYGFYLFMQKTIAPGQAIIPVYVRRLTLLLFFGILHVLLLWAGDILVFYALFGFLLLLFRKKSNRSLMKWAVIIGLIPTLLSAILGLMFFLASLDPHAAEAAKSGVAENMAAIRQVYDQALLTYSNGSFMEIASIRLLEYQLILPGILFFYPMVLAMFLLGLWVARKRFIQDYHLHLTLIRRVFWYSLPLGILINMVYAYAYMHSNPYMPGIWSTLAIFGHAAGGLLLSTCYVTGIILLVSSGRIARLSRGLAAVGRMALTNYLLQSIICTILFYSYGFGLFGKIAHWQGILLTITIFLLQIPLSRWWLSRFSYGPMEGLWRKLTYGQREMISDPGSIKSR